MVVRCERYVVIEAVVVRAIGALLALLRGLLLRPLLLAWLLGLLLLLSSLWRRACKLDGNHFAGQLVARRAIASLELFNVRVIDGEVHELATHQVRCHRFGLFAKNDGFDPLGRLFAILTLTAVITGQG